MLFEAVRFALCVAEETGGAFDPTIGRRMEARGFNRERSTRTHRVLALSRPDEMCTYRDVDVDLEQRTITLRRPLILDLGAVAKGLAVDTAARELQPFEDFAIDAGGDLYLGGMNREAAPWSVGIRHPRMRSRADRYAARVRRGRLHVGRLRAARSAAPEHHILDPRSGDVARRCRQRDRRRAERMLADALATAAFVLGPVRRPASARASRRRRADRDPALECARDLRTAAMTLRHFFKTPKGLLTIVLAILAAMPRRTRASRSSAPGLACRGHGLRGRSTPSYFGRATRDGTFRAAPCSPR